MYKGFLTQSGDANTEYKSISSKCLYSVEILINTYRIGQMPHVVTYVLKSSIFLSTFFGLSKIIFIIWNVNNFEILGCLGVVVDSLCLLYQICNVPISSTEVSEV